MASSDRRRSRRTSREIPALLRSPEDPDSGLQRGRIEDVGGDGFRLRSPAPLLVHQRIRVYPWGEGDGLTATVMWTRSASLAPETDRFSSPVIAGCRLDRGRDRDQLEEPPRPGLFRMRSRSLDLLKWALFGTVGGLVLLALALLVASIVGR